ncbi:hypothetical protein R1G70_03700 [Stenotrophomonas sp. C960]|uniref:hypothetical protein n=1 Tax=unclassified Stenotrophomonas TaxID=196198 RepID=UPI00293C3DDE|nr:MULTISPECIES: hypothetical protein [unclassified Stenotrophomonas]MDV3463751.1 hypothetical protein [Stenotrophomonas sp. C960]MDV3531962.1 hypothetical protein [Stenotrophomonas sp. C2866]
MNLRLTQEFAPRLGGHQACLVPERKSSLRAGSDFSNIRPLLKAIFSELMPGFSFVKPWGLLHFDPVEYPVTKEELAGFQKAAMQSGVNFCFLSTWEQRHEDKDLLEVFK